VKASRWLAALLPLLSACSKPSRGTAAPVDDAGGDGASAFTYTPQGCLYSYTPPSSLGYENLALDDTGPVDPVNGVPQRVRLGFGGGTAKGQPGYADPTTTAAFTWETAESDHAAKVRIGTLPASLTHVSTGYTWTALASIGNQPSYFHEVHVCGLTPATTYFYQVGGGPTDSEVWSATQSFTTVPPTGPLTVGLFGDARDAVATWQAVHMRMRDAAVALSLVGGDVVDSAALESLYVTWLDAIWHDPNDASSFLTLGQQYIIPINGNHENDLAMSFANWALPGDGPYAETYASFDVGNAHFTMIDDQQIGEDPTGTEAMAQLRWVDQDLAAANGDRANHPFIVVIGHRCMYSSSTHGTDSDVLAARASLVPIYDRYSVDLVVNGHDHDYERSKPLKAGSPPGGAPVVGAGTTYVVSAGAGADAYPTGTPQPFTAISVAYGSGTTYIGSYSLLQLQGNTLKLTAYGLKASSSTVAGDDVIDSFDLTH
jgi:acid phosphatase type 7